MESNNEAAVSHLKAYIEVPDDSAETAYEILGDNTVIVREATPLDKAYLKGLDHSLNEWNSDEDDKAYKFNEKMMG